MRIRHTMLHQTRLSEPTAEFCFVVSMCCVTLFVGILHDWLWRRQLSYYSSVKKYIYITTNITFWLPLLCMLFYSNYFLQQLASINSLSFLNLAVFKSNLHNKYDLLLQRCLKINHHTSIRSICNGDYRVLKRQGRVNTLRYRIYVFLGSIEKNVCVYEL